MNKEKIEVPGGIRFLSDWEDFKLSNFSNKCIINKQIPGCGFTEYCIRSNENIILCSPRKLLLENKWDQHKGEVYLVRNEMDKDPGVDKDISKPQKSVFRENMKNTNGDLSKEKRHEIYQKIYSDLEQYRNECVICGKPMKILVTYDSYHIVLDILNRLNISQLFYTVIDEFQSILHDSRFKSNTELNFLEIINNSSTALFVSATPTLEEYLSMLNEFKNLPYYELDWYTQDPSRIVKPNLRVLTMKSVGTKAEEIINKYLRGNFEELIVMKDGIPTKIISNEAVIYVNSVNHIISIIKKCNLQPEQVNILCADTEDNKSRIKRRLGKEYSIGKVPKRGESHKMFTFCTRTTYLGADFYSTCARSFIFSDSNSDCLAVDIEEDLPQILGRQRLVENPWKNSATFYYRSTADYKKMSAENFENIINQKKKKTENLLGVFNSASDFAKQDLAENYQKIASTFNYKDDYVAVNKIKCGKSVILSPIFNNLVLVNELRAFRIQQIDYQDRFTVFSTINNTLIGNDIINQEAQRFLEEYNSLTEARKKLIFLCESSLNGRLSKEAADIVLDQIPDSDYIKSYYQILGPERLKSLSYIRANIEKELGIITFSKERLIIEIYSNFHIGEKYTLANLKNKLSLIYSSINYSATPKASDIENWFDVKTIVVYEKNPETGKRKQIRGYELIGSKQ